MWNNKTNDSSQKTSYFPTRFQYSNCCFQNVGVDEVYRTYSIIYLGNFNRNKCK